MQIQRLNIQVSGVVQGVGFRPFVFRLANTHRLSGSVKNSGDFVCIEVEGHKTAVEFFLKDLLRESPPLAQIRELISEPRCPTGEMGFRIDPSEDQGDSESQPPPDVAVCNRCIAELFDPSNRRYRYPFINCVDCGPRFSIITRFPYDRCNTTMDEFAMCSDCATEYADPASRRFHAQPIGCPQCGPQVQIKNSFGERLDVADSIVYAAEGLKAGKICCVKGMSGFHLACNATDEKAIGTLRHRKHRDDKPFAIMVSLVAAEKLCHISETERNLLLSRQSPIVLLRRRPESGLAENLAFGNPLVGVCLPYTPLHHLLIDAVQGMPLVMTSGNISDEPVCFEDDSAIKKLSTVADFFLTHNRRIHLPGDDSVARVSGATPSLVRRSRGFAPSPIHLPLACTQPTLAMGAQMKSVFAYGRGSDALLSHHLGDLDSYDAELAFDKAIQHYGKLFNIQPQCVVHDLHPDYASTRLALQRIREFNLKPVAVQHHHAHMASAMAENGLSEPVIGVIFDGTGLGVDGTIWGGEFLVGEYARFDRAAHFRYVRMPGSSRAIAQPWRMALSYLLDAGVNPEEIIKRVPQSTMRQVSALTGKDAFSPKTSSCGRFFDAVAAMIGVRNDIRYEGQAAIELEWLAAQAEQQSGYAFELDRRTEPMIIDIRPMVRAIATDVKHHRAPAEIARAFHTGVVDIVADVCMTIRAAYGIDRVVLSGGVFANTILLSEVPPRLEQRGFRVYTHSVVPCNDGGLCLGQLAVAAVH